MLRARWACERWHQLAHAATRVLAKKGMHVRRRTRRCDCETIFSSRPHCRAVSEQDRLKVEIWPFSFDPKFCCAAVPANRFEIDIPIVVGAKRDPPCVLGINHANGLLVRIHDRIDTISSRSSRAISFRLPARILAGENE